MLNEGNTSTKYYFAKSIQGDVMALIAENGTIVARYDYDAYGKLLSVKDASGAEITDPSHIANLNPIRYRGYYFDSETGFYYLNSRYYDPEICRFISPDDASLLGANGTIPSYNLYAYCENNPVNCLDVDGNLSELVVAALMALGGGLINAVSTYLACKITGQENCKNDVIAAFVAGAVGSVNPLCGALVSGAYTMFSLMASGCGLSASFCGGFYAAGFALLSIGSYDGIMKLNTAKGLLLAVDSVMLIGLNAASAGVTQVAKSSASDNSKKNVPYYGGRDYNSASIHGRTYDMNLMQNIQNPKIVHGRTYDWTMV